MFEDRKQAQTGGFQRFCGPKIRNRSGGGGRFESHILLAGVMLAALGISACSGERPTSLGVQAGRLSPCPDTPNCVSSFAPDADHFIKPLLFSATAPEVMRRVKQALGRMERVEIIREEPHYLHAEFTSLVFRFVDDVELYLDEKTGTLHFRSASRLGHSDLGVNRERIETLKQLLEKTDQNASNS